MSSTTAILPRLLPIFSNLMYLLPASRSLVWGLGVEAFLWTLVALFTSPAYHLCMGFPTTCWWSVRKYIIVDFWPAELALVVIALQFIRFRAPFIKNWIILLAIIAIGLLVTGTDSNFMSQAVIGGVSGAVVVIYLIWYRIAHGYWPDYDMTQMTLGIGFLLFGVCFFIVQDWWPPFYDYTHSYWHMSVPIGIFFFIAINPPKPQYVNIDARIDALTSSPVPLTPAQQLELMLLPAARVIVDAMPRVMQPKWNKNRFVVPP